MLAVNSMTESIRQSIDNNKFGGGIFIGWKKNLSIQLIMQFYQVSSTIMKIEAMCMNAFYYPTFIHCTNSDFLIG